ncbi:MAG: ABC transporter substrate-binding protein [Hyphomicrobiales bacterium]
MTTRLKLMMAALLLTGAPALANDKVTLRLDYVYGSEHAPIFLARDKGFFAKQGIDVQILPGEGSTVTVKLVGNGTADFGYASADQGLMAYAKDLPVVSTAVILQKSAVAIIFPTDTGIKELTDLYGRTLGVPFLSVGEKQWRALAKINNLDTSKIKEVPVDRNIAAMIEAKKVDASVAFFFNDGIKAEVDGIPMSWILFADKGVSLYSTSLVTSADLIKKNPDLVRRFTHAFVEGWTYSMTHQQEALDAFLKDNPTADVKYATLKLPEVLKLTQTDDTVKNGIGWSSKEKWEAMQKILLDLEIMQNKVEVEKAFTNEFLK